MNSFCPECVSSRFRPKNTHATEMEFSLILSACEIIWFGHKWRMCIVYQLGSLLILHSSTVVVYNVSCV